MSKMNLQREAIIVISATQKQLLAEILGNIGVGWFTTGIVSPLLLNDISMLKLLFSVGLGILFAAGFILTALLLIKSKG